MSPGPKVASVIVRPSPWSCGRHGRDRRARRNRCRCRRPRGRPPGRGRSCAAPPPRRSAPGRPARASRSRARGRAAPRPPLSSAPASPEGIPHRWRPAFHPVRPRPRTRCGCTAIAAASVALASSVCVAARVSRRCLRKLASSWQVVAALIVAGVFVAAASALAAPPPHRWPVSANCGQRSISATRPTSPTRSASAARCPATGIRRTDVHALSGAVPRRHDQAVGRPRPAAPTRASCWSAPPRPPARRGAASNSNRTPGDLHAARPRSNSSGAATATPCTRAACPPPRAHKPRRRRTGRATAPST